MVPASLWALIVRDIRRLKEVQANVSVMRASNHLPMSLKLSAVQLGDAASDFGTATIDFVAASNWKTALSQVASVCEMVE